MVLPYQPDWGFPWVSMLGSCQTEDNIGSSVKLTNIEISTAAAMVRPNSWKNLPMMPPMKPIGMNTATIDSVVASTARPISWVPSSEAWWGVLPIWTWRTMFSRTTIASSISSPTHRLSAISVSMLMVKPNMFMNRKVPMIAMGSVRPVITVERQEFRNRNTISTVSTAPSIRVRRTLSTDTRIWREPSVMGCSAMPGGRRVCMSATAFSRPSTTAMVFSSCDFWTVSSRVRSPLYSARLSTSWAPSDTRAICSKRIGAPFLRATMILPNSSGRWMRASIWITRSCSRERMAPSGRSWFSLRTAATTWSAVMPKASMACGFR